MSSSFLIPYGFSRTLSCRKSDETSITIYVSGVEPTFFTRLLSFETILTGFRFTLDVLKEFTTVQERFASFSASSLSLMTTLEAFECCSIPIPEICFSYTPYNVLDIC